MRQWFRTRLDVRLPVLIAVVAETLVLYNSLAFAAPPPAGTIYYSVGSNTAGSPYLGGVLYAIKGDGSGQTANLLPDLQGLTQAPNIVQVNPSFRKYGSSAVHDRWWLIPLPTGEVYPEVRYAGGTVKYNVPHNDLFAVRSNPVNRSQLVTVQLTDLYGVVMFPAPINSCWSNDSNEGPASFVQGSFVYDIRDAIGENPDGTTVVDVTRWVPSFVNVPLTATEINDGWANHDFKPFGPETALPAEIDAAIHTRPTNTFFPRIDGQGLSSPDSAFYLLATGDAHPTPRRMFKMAAATDTPAQLLWDGNAASPGPINQCQWSPDGSKIAITDYVSGWPEYGNVWTMPANGSAAPKKVLDSGAKGSTTTMYTNPIWSPDNKYLVVQKQQWSGTTLTGLSIMRLSLTDGKTLDLVQLPMTAGTATLLQRWVADN